MLKQISEDIPWVYIVKYKIIPQKYFFVIISREPIDLSSNHPPQLESVDEETK